MMPHHDLGGLEGGLLERIRAARELQFGTARGLVALPEFRRAWSARPDLAARDRLLQVAVAGTWARLAEPLSWLRWSRAEADEALAVATANPAWAASLRTMRSAAGELPVPAPAKVDLQPGNAVVLRQPEARTQAPGVWVKPARPAPSRPARDVPIRASAPAPAPPPAEQEDCEHFPWWLALLIGLAGGYGAARMQAAKKRVSRRRR